MELNYIYNKGRGRQRVYDLDQEAIAAFTYTIGTKLADLTQPLLGGVSMDFNRNVLVLTVHIGCAGEPKR